MNMVLDAAVTLVSLAAIAQYGWSMRGHFSSEGTPRGALLLSTVVLLITLSYLLLQWLLDQPAAAQLAGIVLQLLSLVLFWAAIKASRQAKLLLAFDAGNPSSIVTVGPYKYLRHPFYTSYIVFWFGWAVAVWSPLAILPFGIIVGIYVFAALDEERKFANTPMAPAYEEYKRRAGFFWPRLQA